MFAILAVSMLPPANFWRTKSIDADDAMMRYEESQRLFAKEFLESVLLLFYIHNGIISSKHIAPLRPVALLRRILNTFSCVWSPTLLFPSGSLSLL